MPIVIGSTSAGVLGTLTLGDIKTLIQAHGYGTDTAGVQTQAVRQALRYLYGIRRWSFLRKTSSAFSATTTNAGLIDISTLGRGIMLDSVRMSLGSAFYDLEHKLNIDVEKARWEDQAQGIPRYWSRSADTIELYPRPDATYPLEIVYQGLTTLPSADGDTIQWPETHIDCVVYAAIRVLAFRQRDANSENRADGYLTEALVTAMRDDEATDRQTDLEVGHWDGWRLGGVGLP